MTLIGTASAVTGVLMVESCGLAELMSPSRVPHPASLTVPTSYRFNKIITI